MTQKGKKKFNTKMSPAFFNCDCHHSSNMFAIYRCKIKPPKKFLMCATHYTFKITFYLYLYTIKQ